MVSQRCDGCSTRSHTPGSTRGADSLATASFAYLMARSGSVRLVTYSQPMPTGATALLRVCESELSDATAVTLTFGLTRMKVC